MRDIVDLNNVVCYPSLGQPTPYKTVLNYQWAISAVSFICCSFKGFGGLFLIKTSPCLPVVVVAGFDGWVGMWGVTLCLN